MLIMKKMTHITDIVRQCGWLLLLWLCTTAAAQNVIDEVKAKPERSAGLAYSLPTDLQYTDTPAPDGKKPFYISHFGSSAAYYLENMKDYQTSLVTLAKADSVNMLTPLGKDVLRRLRLIEQDALHRTGELTAKGARQMRLLAQQMVDRFPDMFVDGSYVDGRSIVRNHSIMSLQEFMTQIARHPANMELRLKSSHSNDPWMYVRDKELEADRLNAETKACYQAFIDAHHHDKRLMESLFVSPEYIKEHVDTFKLCDHLFTVANSIQNLSLDGKVTLYDIYTPEEIAQHWRILNAKHYISYGCFELNGGNQPFAQRAPLWNLLHQGDSIKKLDFPVVHLRYSSRGMVMSLICLMELNGYGLKTADLNQLEQQGWADYRIAPFGSSVQVVYYRKDKTDDDILIKVVLNGQEASLPIETDLAPYYHWQDVKRYYLRKLYAHEKLRFDYKKKKNEQSNQ